MIYAAKVDDRIIVERGSMRIHPASLGSPHTRMGRKIVVLQWLA